MAAIALILLVQPGCGVSGQKFPVELRSELQKILDESLAGLGAPGATIVVVMPNGSRWSGATGFDDPATGDVMLPTDILRVGSVTKTFNAAIILQMEEQGLLSLDEPVDNWVKGFDLGASVTVRRVLAHTAGIYNYTDNPGFLDQVTATQDEVVQFALNNGSVFEPGAGWSYSNTGYFLSGMVIEAVDGVAFHISLRNRILVPLGLLNTYLDGFESGPLAQGHVAKVPAEKAVPNFDMSWAWAAGGIASNGDDLCTWARSSLWSNDDRPTILGVDAKKKMQAETILVDNSGTGYGLGLRLTKRAGRKVIGHTGSTMGFKGELFVDAENGACVALSTNDFLAEPGELREAIWARLVQEFESKI